MLIICWFGLLFGFLCEVECYVEMFMFLNWKDLWFLLFFYMVEVMCVML